MPPTDTAVCAEDDVSHCKSNSLSFSHCSTVLSINLIGIQPNVCSVGLKLCHCSSQVSNDNHLISKSNETLSKIAIGRNKKPERIRLTPLALCLNLRFIAIQIPYCPIHYAPRQSSYPLLLN